MHPSKNKLLIGMKASGYRELIRREQVSAVLARFLRWRSSMALADQMMISASNFATGIVLVRGLGLSEFGKYSIAYALLLYANALQMSFIASPMLSIAPLLGESDKRQFVNGMLAFQILSSMLLFVVFALVGGVARIFTTYYSLPCVLAFACCVGTFQLQDWLRRYYFLYRKGKLAIASDFISYLGQFVLLLVLWRMGRLSLLLTFLVMCVTSVAAVIMGPITDRLRPAMGELRETWDRCKGLSRDLLVAGQVRWLGNQGVILVGAAIVGSSGIGGLRAVQSLAGPVALVLMSLENYFPIRIAEEITRKGAVGAHALVERVTIVGIVCFTLLITPVGILGKPILKLLYGQAMVAFYKPMLLQLTAVLAGSAAMLWFHLYRGVQDARAILRANIFASISNAITIYWFGRFWGASGIVLSSLFAQVTMVGYCMFHWKRHNEELKFRHPPGVHSEPAPP